MGKTKYLTAPVPSDKTPAGIPYILGNELAERFSFYGMRCILVFFMTHLLANAAGELAPMTEDQSKVWFHLFVSAVYFTPLIGALISDIWLGKYRTILFFSMLYCLGYAGLAFNHTRVGLGAGLILIAIGSGVIKPCVSANVGDQFGKTNKHLLARMYSWFYFAINLGAFISNLLIPELLDRYNATVAFGVPGGLMVLATFVFWLGRKKFVHIPRGGAAFVKECFSGEGLKTIGKLAIIYLFVARQGMAANPDCLGESAADYGVDPGIFVCDLSRHKQGLPADGVAKDRVRSVCCCVVLRGPGVGRGTHYGRGRFQMLLTVNSRGSGANSPS